MPKYKYMLVPENEITSLKERATEIREIDDNKYLVLLEDPWQFFTLGASYEKYKSGRAIYKEKIGELNGAQLICLDCIIDKVDTIKDNSSCIVVGGKINIIELNGTASNYKHLPTIVEDCHVFKLVLNCGGAKVLKFKCDKLVLNIAHADAYSSFKNCDFKAILHIGTQDFSLINFQNTTLTYDSEISKNIDKKYIPFLVYLLSDQTMYTSRNDIIKTIQHIESKKNRFKGFLFWLHQGNTKILKPLIILCVFLFINIFLIKGHAPAKIKGIADSHLTFVLLPHKAITDLIFRDTNFNSKINFSLLANRAFLFVFSVFNLYLAFCIASAIRKKFGFRSQTLKSIMPSEKKI